MKRLFQLFLTYQSFFVFLSLEAIAFYLLFQFNKFHNIRFVTWFNEVSAGYNRQISQIKNYFILQEENQKLRDAYIKLQEKNLKLQEALNYYQNRVPYTSRLILNQDSIARNKYKFIPAKVVKTEILGKYNYMIIDKGQKDSLPENAGVVSSEGIVGITKKIGENYSSCVSILNPKVYISVYLMPHKILGTFTWDGKDPTQGVLKYIPFHYYINEGQEVVTSGLDNVFPPDIRVGKIVNVQRDPKNSGFLIAKVKLASDFYSLNNVYVVFPEAKKEIDSLSYDIQSLYK